MHVYCVMYILNFYIYLFYKFWLLIIFSCTYREKQTNVIILVAILICR